MLKGLVLALTVLFSTLVSILLTVAVCSRIRLFLLSSLTRVL